MPEPYRALLVHHGDMTSRLEDFHGAPMTLRVLNRETSGDAYRREVLLCKANDGLPVEYGAIEINLAAFDEVLRAEILEGWLPLGGLLNHHGIRYRSEPRAFLRIATDTARPRCMAAAMCCSATATGCWRALSRSCVRDG
jgi:chorismate-pyruvate lyase